MKPSAVGFLPDATTLEELFPDVLSPRIRPASSPLHTHKAADGTFVFRGHQPTTIQKLAAAVYPSFAMLAGMQRDVFTPLKDGR
jgi:hypothetical protein